MVCVTRSRLYVLATLCAAFSLWLVDQSAAASGSRFVHASGTDPDPTVSGRWETVTPAEDGAALGKVLGMQTVHTVLLPSGKILYISGSSWRNLETDLDRIEYYPEVPDPKAPRGAFVKETEPFKYHKLRNYYQIVNNAAIYDPAKNTFYRIPHPLPRRNTNDSDSFAPNDLFCTGHMHLPNGNVLFAGGTEYYDPYRTGLRSSFIFDWRKELKIDWRRVDWRRIPDEKSASYPWVFSGFMKHGRWYPHMVPLLDGRLTVFGGFIGFDFEDDHPEPYRFEMNHYVEFFDSYGFDPDDPQGSWRAVDVKTLANSPYTTPIDPVEEVGDKYCGGLDRCVEDFAHDAFKLYPNNYLLQDGRIFLTREGDWVSLRTEKTEYMRRSKKTYFMNVEGTLDKPAVSFSPGPNRPDYVTSYGTSLLDPNDGNIKITGGQPISNGTRMPLNAPEDKRFRFAGGRGSRKMEVFEVPKSADSIGKWTLHKDALGDRSQDDRTMHYSLILPTKQILIINGGNYDFYGPIYQPLLMTPLYDAQGLFTGHYETRRLNEAMQPRLYHNSAILLPDARILVASGNTSRATVRNGPDREHDPTSNRQPKPDLGRMDVDVYFFDGDGRMGRAEKGMLDIPAEDWVAEIFSPPYLFIDGDRRPVIQSLTRQGKPTEGYEFRTQLDGKVFYLLQGEEIYQAELDQLPDSCGIGKASLVMMKLGSVTHGWDSGQRLIDLPFRALDRNNIQFQMPNAQEENIPPAFYMLFYTDCRGKPSVAQILRYDDRAKKL